MRNPARCVAGNLIFNFYGDVWALWAIDPVTYARLSDADKLAWHAGITGLLLTMSTESMILGLSRPVRPAATAAAMRAGVDLDAHPEWADLVDQSRRTLEANPLTERCHYLAVKLPTTGNAKATRRALGAAAARVGGQFRIAAVPVPAADLRSARIQADELVKPLARHIGATRIRPATEAEIEWIYGHSLDRGMDREASLEDFANAPTTVDDTRPRARNPRLVAAADVVMTEGGDATDPDRPRHRRYLRFDNDPPCYQSFAAFSHVPREWVYPGGKGECLPRISDLGFALDWCLRIRPTANVAAQRAITSQLAQLSGQFDEYGGVLSGVPDSLAESIEENRAVIARLGASPSTPELQVTFIIGIGAPTLRQLEERHTAVRTMLGANEHEVHRPTGDQRALWGAMMPGSPTPAVCRDYGQFMLPADLAGTGPLTGCGLGDPVGGFLALNLDGGCQPVLFRPAYGPSMAPEEGGPRSGSTGLCGKLGSGKSQTAKRLMWEAVAAGGQVMVADRTRMHEYARIAKVMPGTNQIVQLDNNAISLDPMRVFTGDAAVRYTVGFLTLLTHTEPSSLEGAELAEAVRAVHADGGSLADVVQLLADGGADDLHTDYSRDLAKKLSVFTRGVGLAQVAFGSGAPLRLDADYIVFDVPQMTLPSREALLSEALSRRLMPEQIFSQALLYLITAVMGEVALSNRKRFSMVVIDEGYALTASPEGVELLTKVVKDGRKHNAGLLFITHLPSEIPKAVTDGLGARFLFRTSRESAPEGLAWLGLIRPEEVAHPTASTQALVDVIAEDTRRAGQCLFVDRFGRAGLVSVLEPHTPGLVAAFNTGLHAFSADDDEDAPESARLHPVAPRHGARRRAPVRR